MVSRGGEETHCRRDFRHLENGNGREGATEIVKFPRIYIPHIHPTHIPMVAP